MQPGQSINQLMFCGLAGIGFGSPLILIVSATQLSTPHSLIATATAISNSTRAVAGTIFIAGFGAALNDRLSTRLGPYIAAAAAQAGLPASSISDFITALLGTDPTAVSNVAGVTPAIIASGVAGMRQAFADSLRVVWIIAAPFGAVACIACFFMGDLKKTMNYRVDAPAEKLHAKSRSNV